MIVRPRISFFIYNLGPGGSERQLTLLANSLCRQAEVTIYPVGTLSSNSFYTIDEDVRVLPIGVPLENRGTLHKISVFWMRIRQIRKILRSSKSTETVFVSFGATTNIFCIIASFGLKAGLYLAERTDPRFVPKKVWLRCLTAFGYRFSEKVICQTQEIGEYFRGLGVKTSVVHNGFIKPSSAPESGVCRKGPIRFVIVARLVPEKRVVETVAIFQRIASQNEDFTLVIYGDGVQKNQLLEMIGRSRNIEYRGVSKNILDDFREFDYLVLGSKYEGFPNVLIEALFCGLGVVVTPVTGALEIRKVSETERLTICPFSDFFENLKEIIDNRKRVTNESAGNLELFSIEKIREDWIEAVGLDRVQGRKQDGEMCTKKMTL